MNFSGVHQREKRNPSQMYHPMHNSVASYWTEALQKNEMKHDFGDEIFLNNIHLIPDPLKKNLADTLFTTDLPKRTNKTFLQETTTQQNQKVPLKTQNMPENPSREANQNTTLGGIGSFFSGVLSVLTNAMFRSRSPVNYYDCYDDGHQRPPHIWPPAKTDEQDKNGQADDRKSYDAPSNPNVSSDMNFDSRGTVTNCESKLNQVLHLLTPRQTSSPVWVRKRPKKVFVEPGSVEDSFEDAFTPEDFVSEPNDSYIEYYSPVQYHCAELQEAAAQKTKLNMAPVKEIAVLVNKSDLELKKDDSQSEKVSVQSEQDKVQLEKDNVQDNSKLDQVNVQLDGKELHSEKELRLDSQTASLEVDKTDAENPGIKHELVSSCEDKLSKLKLLLQEKRMKCKAKREAPEASHTSPPRTIPAEKIPADKHFKNPKRRTSKRQKSKLKCRIEDDLVFANEISLDTPPSVENSPMQHANANFGDYFDEVSGRFRSASIGSEDSFQIVFNDCPKPSRMRTISDCDSEDSFIIFEESPESCYMSNDVFGESEESDTESEMSDSGCGMMTCKLAHNLSRTVSNLADDSLYVESEDEVDFARVETVSDVVEERKSGLLLDDKKKLMRKSQTPKTVHFSTDPPRVHVLRVWAFAARQARAGHWERFAVDRERFKRRIADADMAVSWVLKPQHRRRVMFQRFMPWWNQLKRKELAEKKEREAEEKRKAEESSAEDRLEEGSADHDDANTNECEKENDVKRETDSVQEQPRREAITDKELEFNNNRIFNSEEGNGKILSKLDTNDNLESKIQVK